MLTENGSPTNIRACPKIWTKFKGIKAIKMGPRSTDSYAMGAAPKTNPVEQAMPTEQEKKNEAKNLFELGMERTDFGKPDSLRFKILTLVLQEGYDRAIQELKDFAESESVYPKFKDKVSRYVAHCVDLVYAIKTKRNFPGMNSLTRAKQQELMEKFKEHYKELQFMLRKIEKVESDLRIEDARSTIYVVRALWIAALSLGLVWFITEIVRGMAITSTVVFEDLITKGTNYLFDLIGW